MNKKWIKINLVFARFLVALMICGLIWGGYYLSCLNPEWFGLPTLCGIYCVCICLTVIVMVLNVIANIIVAKEDNNNSKPSENDR